MRAHVAQVLLHFYLRGIGVHVGSDISQQTKVMSALLYNINLYDKYMGNLIFVIVVNQASVNINFRAVVLALQYCVAIRSFNSSPPLSASVLNAWTFCRSCK